MKKILSHTVLAFMFITQSFWFIGCTTHSEIRKLSHSVECEGKTVKLDFYITEDRLETNVPVN